MEQAVEASLERVVSRAKEKMERASDPPPSIHPDWTPDDWCTPPEILDLVRPVGPVTFDPCTNRWARVDAETALTKEQDGLKAEWPREGLIFVNPPYSTPGPWVSRCIQACRAGSAGLEILLLVPLSGAEWAHRALASAAAVCLWRGRIAFLRPDASGAVAPVSGSSVDSWLFYWGTRTGRFQEAFAEDSTTLLNLHGARRW
jgi:phage N-6-adenine-methyltransferase